MAKTNLKILIVEDEPENAKAAREAFRQLNANKKLKYACSEDIAGTYEEAIERLETKIYHAAILDANFPEKAGEQPRQMGLRLSEEIDIFGKEKFPIPHVILSAGLDYDGHTREYKEVPATIYAERRDLQKVLEFKHSENLTYAQIMSVIEMGKKTKPKLNPDAWKAALSCLLNRDPLESLVELYETKQRIFERRGGKWR